MALERFYKDREEIKKDPFSLWVEPGDYCDWIVPGDKRWDPASFDEKVKVNDLTSFAAHCSKQIIKDFEPIKKKGLGFGIGNHDLVYLSRNSEIQIHQEICDALEVPNLGYSGWFDLYFVYENGFKGVAIKVGNKPPKHYRAKLRVMTHHGIGAAATAGGKMNALKRIVDMVDADLVITGHLHEEIAKKFIRLFPNANCDTIESKTTMGLISSSYLRTYAQDYISYGERKGYAPTSLGASSARYRPLIKRLSVEIASDGVGSGPV